MKAGEPAEKPEFDPKLIPGMRAVAKLSQEIVRLEQQEKNNKDQE
ncbi:MAG: hypothetical protein U5L09_05805 [Bacteroidales bacterium]|nr:hypothetical protein [Bacteroidales bacterium]